jgi:tetratricopeptide (TPR) repeat protein
MLEPGDIEGALAVMNELEREFRNAVASPFKINLEMMAGEFDAILSRLPDLPTVQRTYGDADSANYYMVKGLVIDLKGGLDVESMQARAYYDSARAVWERQLVSRPDDPEILNQLGFTYAGLRDKEKAYYYSDRAVEVMPMSRDALTGVNLLEGKAVVRTLFGDTDEALDILEMLLQVPAYVTPGTLKANPLFSPLHGNPRFQRMIEEKKTL